jgi:hypothetical protein
MQTAPSRKKYTRLPQRGRGADVMNFMIFCWELSLKKIDWVDDFDTTIEKIIYKYVTQDENTA